MTDSLRQRLVRLVPPYLPAPVAEFYDAARAEAERLGDERALEQGSSARSLAWLLRLARGRRQVVEIGTSAGWAAIALALADPERHVTSLDPFPHPQRDRYRQLVPVDVRKRTEFVRRDGRERPPPGQPPVDFLFIDEAHEREGVVACFLAWRPALAPGAVVVFHDYDESWPGVIEAVEELGLEGRVRGKSFVWSAPEAGP